MESVETVGASRLVIISSETPVTSILLTAASPLVWPTITLIPLIAAFSHTAIRIYTFDLSLQTSGRATSLKTSSRVLLSVMIYSEFSTEVKFVPSSEY